MWPAIHVYRTAVAKGDAPAIMCPDDGTEIFPVADRNGNPALKCLTCRTVYVLGTHVWDQIEAAIKELHANLQED